MNLWQRLKASLGWSKESDTELERELEAHIELREEQMIAKGMTPAEARREARRQFGNRLRIQEDARSADLFPALETAARELRQAVRSLSSRPGLIAVAVASLALGVGANAILFSAMDAIFWKPLPLRDAARLIDIQQTRDGQPSGGNAARARDYHARLQSVEGVAGYYSEGVILPGEAGPQRATAFRTFGPLMKILGVEPARGRRFTAEEEAGSAPVAILTDAFWRTRFSSDPAVAGQTLRTSVTTFTIVGVLPPGADFPRGADFWAPADKQLQTDARGASFLGMTARMRPGVTPEKVSAELRTVNAALAQEYPNTDRGIGTEVAILSDPLAPRARMPLLAAWAAVGVVLLIACLNIASLLLARGLERTREATIRAALGASRWTLVRTFLAESLLLGAGGAVAGLLLAIWGIDFLRSSLSTAVPLALDYRVIGFTLLLTMLCALAFGLIPAWQTARAGLAGQLNELARSTGGQRRFWLRGATVVAQTALSLILLSAAGLLLASFENQRRAPLGFSPERLIAVRVNLPWDTDMAVLHDFTRRTQAQLQALPGMEAVAVTDRLPLEGGSQSGEILLRDRTLPPSLAKQQVNHRAVSESYFSVLRVPWRMGRTFEARPGTEEAVVNEAFVRAFFPGENPVGRLFATARQDPKKVKWMTITGVVGDLRVNPNAAAPTPEFYHSFDRTYWPMLTFVASTRVPLEQMAPAIREAVRTIDPNKIVDGIGAVEDELAAALDTPRRMLLVSVTFAAIALLMALIGLYGVMASEVNQRRREFGIRLALGATRAELLRQSLWRGAKLALIGAVIGGLGSVFLQRQAVEWLYGVTPGDPRWLLAAAGTLIVAALAASLRPAWRGASLDPAITLRHE